jgi:hypothetical protein
MVHRCNDIAGFVQVFWDGGTRILVVYYFRGLKRPGFGDVLRTYWGGTHCQYGFYPIPYTEVGGIPNLYCSDEVKRAAINEALDRIRADG